MRHKDSNTQLLEHEYPPLTTRPGQPPVFLTSLPTVPKQKQCNMGLSTRSRSSWARRRFTRPNWIRSWSKSLLIWARICLSRSCPERLYAPMTSMKVPTLGRERDSYREMKARICQNFKQFRLLPFMHCLYCFVI